tara:strand:- start:4228 stop:4506 length:279 start_codon:yes stop_codon:yes gene_type:complete
MISNAIVKQRISPQAFLKKMVDQTKTPPAPPRKIKLLTFEDYKRDIRNRWMLFQREVHELIVDIKKLIDFLSPIVKENFNKIKNLFTKEKKS